MLKNGTLANADQINVSGIGNELAAETVTASATSSVRGAAAGPGHDDDQLSGRHHRRRHVDARPRSPPSTGGTVTDSGEIDLTGTAVLKNGALGNTGQIKVSGTGNALDGETVTNTGGIEVLAGGALLIDPTTINNTGGSITVDSTGTLTLDQATITGGTVTDGGTLNLPGAAV